MSHYETSITYRWPASTAGLIESVEFVRQKNGRAVAYLNAKDDLNFKPQRLEARAAIRAKGWGTLSDFRGGQYVLRVNGITDIDNFVSFLHEANLTQGAPTIASQKAEKEAPKGLIDGLRANSLRASGIFYTLGNVVYLASGLLRSKEKGNTDWGQINSALKWGAGDILVATIGGKDDGRQLTSLLSKLKTHYQREGIDIPATAAIYSETHDYNRGIGNKVYNFLHDYLNQIKCLTESWAAVSYYDAGKKQGNVNKQRTAVTFGIGFLISALVPEKKIDPEKYEQAGSLGRLWMRIQSNPLMVGGLSGYSNTVLTSISAHQEGQRYNNPASYPPALDKVTGKAIAPSKYYKLDYLAPGVMFFGNGLYAMSKKTTGGDIRTEAMVKDVYSVASQILNKQPADTREAAFESTVNFLAERAEVRGNKDEVRAMLRETMTKQSQNPWFEPVALPPAGPSKKKSKPQTPDQPTTPSPHVVTKETTHVAKGVEAANDAQMTQIVGAR